MGVEICFDGYLDSLVRDYQQWRRLYTLTDATGRESQRVEHDRPAFFDFAPVLELMVQTVEPPKAEHERELEQEHENGGKATISEIAKHYAENSVFLKAGVAFLDGFSADEE